MHRWHPPDCESPQPMAVGGAVEPEACLDPRVPVRPWDVGGCVGGVGGAAEGGLLTRGYLAFHTWSRAAPNCPA